jgi:hypothetical protein
VGGDGREAVFSLLSVISTKCRLGWEEELGRFSSDEIELG